MEVQALVSRKLKIKKKLLTIRNIIITLLALFFILYAFSIATHETIPASENVKSGLFAFGLLICGTALIITLIIKKSKN